MRPVKWLEYKTVVALGREERSVWKPKVDSRPSSGKVVEGTPGCPGDELHPGGWGPRGGRGGKSEDLTVCRGHCGRVGNL